MPEQPTRGIDVPASSTLPVLSSTPPALDAPAGGASRGNSPDDAARARRLLALAMEIETLPTTHAAFTRLLTVAVETLHAAGAWVGLTMEDSDALVVVAAHGEVPMEQGARVPRDRAFAARALRATSAIFADPSTGVRWNDTVIARVPVRAVAAPLMVDGEHAVGVISIIGGPGRLFTVADGTFANELGSLATLVLRRRDRRAPVAPTEPSQTPDAAFIAPVLLEAAAAVTVDDFAAAVIQRLDDPAFLGVSIAVCDGESGSMRFPAALGALAALRGIRTPLDAERAGQLARQRRAVQMPDARHVVPEAWRSLVPALPGASIALVDDDVAVGRIDIVFDPDRVLPLGATRRIEQQAGTIARALSVLMARVARTPSNDALQSLHTLQRTLSQRLHDLTSPIAGISALSELLVDEALSPDLQELVALIGRSAQRATHAAQALRQLADAADTPADPVSIEALLLDVLRERLETQRALAVHVQLTVDPGMPSIAWPAVALRDWAAAAIIASETALLASARRRIDVRVGLEGPLAVVTVADDGIPIGVLPSDSLLHGATMSVIRTDDGRTIRRLAIPLTIGTTPPLP
jgi:hypothetical protein